MKNTVNNIKEYDIKTIYFNCFDTWMEITTPYPWMRVVPLMTTLNVSPKIVRDLILLQNKDLMEVLLEAMPYIENNPQKMEAVKNAQRDIQSEINSIQLKPWAAIVLPELQKRGYRIGMISNIAKAYVPKVQELSPIRFDTMLLSCEVGKKKTKANTDIYQMAHAETSHKRREIVMIGDHEINDYDVADTYGFYPIHMDRWHKDSKSNRVYTLEKLLDLFPEKQ